MQPTHIVVMGVSGCGKSTLASAIAHAISCPMIEGDDFHPASNVAKMSAGTPLNDADREPWLQTLNEQLKQHPMAVLSCSALKATYREALKQGLPNGLLFVHLDGDFDTLHQRMQARSAHFMPATLLRSQFDTLEPPALSEPWCVTVSINDSTQLQLALTLNYLKEFER